MMSFRMIFLLYIEKKAFSGTILQSGHFLRIVQKSPQFFDRITQHYGNKICCMAGAECVIQDLKYFSKWLHANPVRWKMITTNTFGKSIHETVMGIFTSTYVLNPESSSFIGNLLAEHRIAWIDRIVAYACEKYHNKKPLFVYTSHMMKQKDVALLKKLLQQHLMQGEKYDVHIVHDPHILCGAVVIWDHMRLNMSLNHVIQLLKRDCLCYLPY